jgi:hypothetical protein
VLALGEGDCFSGDFFRVRTIQEAQEQSLDRTPATLVARTTVWCEGCRLFELDQGLLEISGSDGENDLDDFAGKPHGMAYRVINLGQQAERLSIISDHCLNVRQLG